MATQAAHRRKVLLQACREIGAQAADSDGFVPLRSLLKRFSAELHVRPLLVEAMIAESIATTRGAPRWTVFVDSDRYSVDASALLDERSSSPLPDRLRNTVAHELAHSLAFRASEFGMTLEVGRGAAVKEIEREIEEVSPLLLLPERAVLDFLAHGRVDADSLARLRRHLGVSRYLLINRFRLFGMTQERGRLETSAVRNTAIVLGTKTREDQLLVDSWPVFSLFERNHQPAELLNLLKTRQLLLQELLPLTAGGELQGEFATSAGTLEHPRAEPCIVRFSVEERHGPGTFLVVLHRIAK